MNTSNQLLFKLLDAIKARITKKSSDSKTGSFADVNAFIEFRSASKVPNGTSIEYDGFLTALHQLGVPHSESQARLAYGALVAMGDGDESSIQFGNFRALQEFASKRTNMQSTLNLASTRINSQSGRRKSKDRSNKVTTSLREGGEGGFLQMTGRSTSRRSRPPTPGRRVQAKKKSASQLQFQDKMTTKYSTLRAAFRAIDRDNDHVVDWSEVQRLLKNFNMDHNDPHLHQIFLDADQDGDGSIDYQEFQQHFGELLQPTTSGGHGSILQNRSGGNADLTAGDRLGHKLHGSGRGDGGDGRDDDLMTERQVTNFRSGVVSMNKVPREGNGGKKSTSKKKNQKNQKNQNQKNQKYISGGDDHLRRGPGSNASHHVFNDKMKERYKSLRHAFRWMDEDNDHRVSWEEMQRLLRNFNMDENDPTLRSLFLTADADDDGSIDFEEFQITFGELLNPSTAGGHGSAMQNQSGNGDDGGGRNAERRKPTSQRKISRGHPSSTKKLSRLTQGTGSPHKARNKSTGSHDMFHDKMRIKFGTIRQAFRWMDDDNDHVISWPEIQRLLRTFNMNENDSELHHLFNCADCDSSGHIDHQEFQKYFGETIQPSTNGGGGGIFGRGSSSGGSTAVATVPKLALQRVGSPYKHQRNSNGSGEAAGAGSVAGETATLNPLVVSKKLTRSQAHLARAQARALMMESLVQGPPSVYKTLQEKMFTALSNNNRYVLVIFVGVV